MRLKPPAAPQDGATSTPSGDKPTVYRALSSLISGGLMMVFGLAGAVAFAVASPAHPLGAALGLLMAVAGFVGGVYPAAMSHADRVEIRNPFRHIVVAWPRVEDVVARLSLVVEAKPEEGSGRVQKFTVWSVPVSMHERRKSDRTIAKQARSAREDALRAAKDAGNAEAILHGGRGSASMRGPQGVAVVDTMAFADQAVSEMTDRRRVCDTPPADAARTTVTWTWWTLGMLAVSVGLVLAAAVGIFK